MADLHGFTDNKERGALNEDTQIAELINKVNALVTTVNSYWQKVYPVGAIYMSTSQTNPASIFGGGTWVQWGSGRVPVGVAANDTAFNTVEKTGGTKTTRYSLATENNATAFAKINSKNDKLLMQWEQIANGPNPGGYYSTNYQVDTDGIGTGSTSGNEWGVTLGGWTDQQTNLQPYITCYMWKRTA